MNDLKKVNLVAVLLVLVSLAALLGQAKWGFYGFSSGR